MKLKSRVFGVACATFWLVSAVQGATTNGVRIGDFFFNPTNLVIRPGDRVIWTNIVSRTHDTTGPTNLWLSPNLGLNGTFGFTFNMQGYYPYVCRQHVQQGIPQTGSVHVVNASLAAVSNSANGFSFEVRGGRQGLKTVIEAGANLTALAPISTNPFPASGIVTFNNAPPLPGRRFYRARIIP